MTEMILTLENDSMIPSIKEALGKMKGILRITTRRSGKAASKNAKTKADLETEAFFRDVFGKSTDPRSAEEIIRDIYSSRVNKDESFLEEAFK